MGYKSAMDESNEFYCAKKRCRKTVQDTPEYLTQGDWYFLKTVVDLLEKGDANGLHLVLCANVELSRAFFYRVIGWPEGAHYSYSVDWFEKTAFPGLVEHKLPELKAALRHRDLKSGA